MHQPSEWAWLCFCSLVQVLHQQNILHQPNTLSVASCMTQNPAVASDIFSQHDAELSAGFYSSLSTLFRCPAALPAEGFNLPLHNAAL